MANTYTLRHTAPVIDDKLDLIDENKNLLEYPYNGTLPAGFEDVGDGSILTPANTDAATSFTLTNCPLLAGKYTFSFNVTNIAEESVSKSGFLLKVDEQTSGTLPLDTNKTVTVELTVPKISGARLLIKPQIEEYTDGTATDWVPNMDKIGTYVDRRFNSTNAKIRVIQEQIDSFVNVAVEGQ
jgi:hypothetical protein